MIRRLYDQGKIDPWLVAGWGARSVLKDGRTDLHDKHRSRMCMLAFGAVAFAIHLYVMRESGFTPWKLLCPAMAALCWTFERSRFARDLNRLNRLMTRHNGGERKIYFLKDQIPDIDREAQRILVGLGVELERVEKMKLPSKDARSALWALYGAHNTLFAFGVCDENPAKYLFRNRPMIPPEINDRLARAIASS